MSEKDPRSVVAHLWTLYNDDGLSRIPDMFSEDGACNYAATPQGPAERVVGKAAMRARIEGMLATFRDIGIEVHQAVADEETVASRWTWRGTLRAPVGGAAPGTTLRMDGVTFHVVRNGVTVESFDTWAAPELEEDTP